MRWARIIWEEILDALYPPRCAACALVGCDGWCDECADSIAYISLPVCARCGTPVDPEGFCSSCPVHSLVPEVVRTVARYDGVIRSAIHRFKYGNRASLAPALARLLIQTWQTPLTEPLRAADVVVPVPIHRQRERERGFNQSALLAREFCRSTGLPLLQDVLERTVYRQPQVGLDAAERRENVKDAFRVTQPQAVAGKSVLLIDDVWTTGSTLNEAARALLTAGAERVFAYTVAHEPL
ncbi:MAG: amidophosphoribosyltransferase [Armatimonadota bacterium]|nr:MAG: amidophosphoribosyltransferase [Armatimonadota bacterium]